MRDVSEPFAARNSEKTPPLAATPGAATATGTGTLPWSVALTVPVRRIATFHLNGLGDLLFTLPALYSLRETFPGANICAVIRPALAPLLRDSPFVDEILLRPRKGVRAQLSLMMKLRLRRLDMAVAFSQSRQTTSLAWASGATVRAGFEAARLEGLLTHLVPKEGPPSIETHLDLVRALGCATRQYDYCNLLHVGPQYTQAADRLLAERGVEGPFIMVACEASERRGIKEYPVEHWATALDALAERWPVVLVGTRPTLPVTTRMKRAVVDIGGLTDLSTLAAMCGRAALFAGIDSGVMHLAATMNTPVLGIYGPSDWRITGPRGVPHRIVRHPVECSPCLLTRCKWTGADERKCLTGLDPAVVVQAARELVGV